MESFGAVDPCKFLKKFPAARCTDFIHFFNPFVFSLSSLCSLNTQLKKKNNSTFYVNIYTTTTKKILRVYISHELLRLYENKPNY